MSQQLKAYWNKLSLTCHWQRLHANAVYDLLIELYSQNNRHYHNLTHIEDLYAIAEKQGLLNPVFELSIWFHDAIYDPYSRNNELKSAILAQECLEKLGSRETLAEPVKMMILATRGHQASNQHSINSFLDCDMSILGRPKPLYRAYCENIQKEYRHLNSKYFRYYRRRFLQRVLLRNTIFHTTEFKKNYENQARVNLHWELRRLRLPAKK